MTAPSPLPGPGPAPGPRPPDAIDPVDLLLVLVRRWRLLVLAPVAAAAIAAGVSLVLPKTYTAATSILPPQQSQSAAAAMLSQLGGLAGVAGGALGVKAPSDLYVAMLRSNAVTDPIVARFGLKEVYGLEYHSDVRGALGRASRITADKSGVIVVEVDARDPRLAAAIANAYVEELQKLTATLAVTEAAQRRLFFERQLAQVNDRLAESEVKLREAMERGGLVSVDAQSRAAVETVARLRAQISAKEIQIGAMAAYATSSHPDMRRAEGELASMRQELARLEGGAGGEGGGTPPAPGAPGVANIRLVREVKYNEVLFELVAKQLELARIDESKDAPVVQVLDPAQPPDKKSRPRRGRMVIVSGAATFALAVLAAFFQDALAAGRADPRRAAKLRELRGAWRRRPDGEDR